MNARPAGPSFLLLMLEAAVTIASARLAFVISTSPTIAMDAATFGDPDALDQAPVLSPTLNWDRSKCDFGTFHPDVDTGYAARESSDTCFGAAPVTSPPQRPQTGPFPGVELVPIARAGGGRISSAPPTSGAPGRHRAKLGRRGHTKSRSG